MTKPILTSYPFLSVTNVQGYERYLPSAFDESMSILEKVNKVIIQLNQIGEITNDVVSKWNEVMEWLMNESLADEVTAKLEEWLADGTLAGIINDVLLADINQQITDLIADLASLETTVNTNFANRRVWVSVKENGATGVGVVNDATAIQTTLDANTYVYVPEGSYILNSSLTIKKNTYLKLHPNAKLIRKHNDILLTNYDAISTGYNGQGNIIIEGGIFDVNASEYPDVANGISLAHGDNIKVRDLTILNVPAGHALELTGCRNIHVSDVFFKGYRIDNLGDNYYMEAIQIEPTLPPPTGASYTFPYITDSTPTKDVIIENCYFGPSATYPAHPCGVGAHGAKYDLFYDNIKIVDSLFEGQSYWGIRPFKFTNCIIDNVTIRNGAGGGIYVATPTSGESIKDVGGITRSPQTLFNLKATNIHIDSMTGKGIWVIGGDSASKHKYVFLSSISMKNIGGIAVQLEYVEKSHVNNVVIESVTGRGFLLDNLFNSSITNSFLDTGLENGLLISNSANNKFSNNRINNVKLHGLNISGDNANLIFEGNTIRNASQDTAGTYDHILVTSGVDQIRLINNKLRTDSGFNASRFGLNLQSGVTNATRYGNDLKCGASTGNLSDLSTSPNTSSADLV